MVPTCNRVEIVKHWINIIGKEACQKGYDLIFYDSSSKENREELTRYIEYVGLPNIRLTACFYPCDVSNQEHVEETAKKIGKDFNHVDILFNNAGVMLPSMEIERMPVEEWKATFDINITGMFYVTRYLKPYLLKSKGCIINNGSIAGLQHYAAGRSYAYSASKAAVIQFSHQMAKNYGEEGIRVNCVCPGIIDTPILGDRDRAIYAQRIPLGYVAPPRSCGESSNIFSVR